METVVTQPKDYPSMLLSHAASLHWDRASALEKKGSGTGREAFALVSLAGLSPAVASCCQLLPAVERPWAEAFHKLLRRSIFCDNSVVNRPCSSDVATSATFRPGDTASDREA